MKIFKTNSFLLTLGLILTIVGFGSIQSTNAQDNDNEKSGNERSENKKGERSEKNKNEEDCEKNGDSEGEESGDEFTKNQTYDKVRKGARLILTYNAQKNAFIGKVTNTTNRKLSRVRVEVHLSNGQELGPTKAKSLRPGQSRKVILKATQRAFEKWSAHAEVGSSEHQGESNSRKKSGGDRDKESRKKGDRDSDDNEKGEGDKDSDSNERRTEGRSEEGSESLKTTVLKTIVRESIYVGLGRIGGGERREGGGEGSGRIGGGEGREGGGEGRTEGGSILNTITRSVIRIGLGTIVQNGEGSEGGEGRGGMVESRDGGIESRDSNKGTRKKSSLFRKLSKGVAWIGL